MNPPPHSLPRPPAACPAGEDGAGGEALARRRIRRENIGYLSHAACAEDERVGATTPQKDTCTFNYYKEFLGAELLGVDCSAPGRCKTVGAAGAERLMVLPPVPVDCGTPRKWRNTQCPGTLPGIAQLATEHDFLQFLWSVYARVPRLNMTDFTGILLSACSGLPCSNPTSPGCRRCLGSYEASLVGATPDRLSWAAGGVGSLESGAERYLGLGSQRLDDFLNAATNHGITTNLDP